MIKSYFVVAHNNHGYAYIREVLETSTTIYCDCELGGFSTLAEAEQFVAEVDPQLEAEWLAEREAQFEADIDNEG